LDNCYFVSVKLFQSILAAAEQVNLASVDLLAAIDLSPTVVANADDRLSHSKLVALWQEIVRRSGDPAIGLRLAELTQLETFNVTGYAMSHSPTLGKALDRLVRYSRLLYEGMEFVLAVQPGMAILSYRAVNSALVLPLASVSWTLANIVLWARRSLGTEWPLSKVHLQAPMPVTSTPYRRLFRTTVTFDQPLNALIFEASWLDHALVNANSGLCELLDRYAESLLLKLPKTEGFVAQLQHLLAEELRGREPKLETIATQLGYSPRTLQRKLQQAGTSFQQVLDTIRRELAVQYLQDTQLTTSEIAFLLGFSENSAFNRAFRRWTAMTPGEYRKRERLQT
jgi:AraC-like DNA-binding protein